jgi:uncharacterized membrane protein HdeD (DUF308 family)
MSGGIVFDLYAIGALTIVAGVALLASYLHHRKRPWWRE